MGWLKNGDAQCGTCPKTLTANHSPEILRAARWHHRKGETIGGQDFEDILCPACGHDEHKRVRTVVNIPQEDLFGGTYDRTEQPKRKRPSQGTRERTGD